MESHPPKRTVPQTRVIKQIENDAKVEDQLKLHGLNGEYFYTSKTQNSAYISLDIVKGSVITKGNRMNAKG
jgi:hypothetical protein